MFSNHVIRNQRLFTRYVIHHVNKVLKYNSYRNSNEWIFLNLRKLAIQILLNSDVFTPTVGPTGHTAETPRSKSVLDQLRWNCIEL